MSVEKGNLRPEPGAPLVCPCPSTRGNEDEPVAQFCNDNGYTSNPLGPQELTQKLKDMMDNNGKLIKEFNLVPAKK